MAIQIPPSLASISPEWFTQTLTDSGVINGTSITAIESERLDDGQGFSGQVIRFRLRYHRFEENAPNSIVIKIPPSDPNLRKQISDMGVHKREINFYKEIADKIDIRTPQCYCAAHDEETGDSVILLEDLRNGSIGDNISGCSGREAGWIVEQLAPLHAAWWESPELESIDWVSAQPLLEDPSQKEKWQQQLNQFWYRFSERFAGRIPKPIEEAWPVFVQCGDRIRRQALVPPLTLCHGDYRLDNLFFCDSRAGTQLVVFDWQNITRAQGTHDLAYFIFWNLRPELRREWEKDLLKRYCTALKEQGVEDYSVDQCYHSYQVAVYDLLLARLVRAGAVLDVSTDRAQALADTILTRTSEAIIDYPIADQI